MVIFRELPALLCPLSPAWNYRIHDVYN